MEKNYYLVPVYNEHTFINGFRLSELFIDSFPKVYEQVLKRKELYDKGLIGTEEYTICEKEINDYFNHFVYPEYIIVEENNGLFYEFATKCIVNTDNLANLETHYVDDLDLINDYYNKTRYVLRISNLFSQYLSRSNNRNRILELK